MESPALSTKGSMFLLCVCVRARLFKVTIVSIKEDYLSVDRGGAAYVG